MSVVIQGYTEGQDPLYLMHQSGDLGLEDFL